MDLRYKFLDGYVGEFFTVRRANQLRSNIIQYEIISDKGKCVLYFWVHNEHVIIFRSDKLCDTVSSFFGITHDESACLVRDWIGYKLGLKKIGDLLEFIPNEKI